MVGVYLLNYYHSNNILVVQQTSSFLSNLNLWNKELCVAAPSSRTKDCSAVNTLLAAQFSSSLPKDKKESSSPCVRLQHGSARAMISLGSPANCAFLGELDHKFPATHRTYGSPAALRTRRLYKIEWPGRRRTQSISRVLRVFVRDSRDSSSDQVHIPSS